MKRHSSSRPTFFEKARNHISISALVAAWMIIVPGLAGCFDNRDPVRGSTVHTRRGSSQDTDETREDADHRDSGSYANDDGEIDADAGEIDADAGNDIGDTGIQSDIAHDTDYQTELGGFGVPCDNDNECVSGKCVENHRGEKMCTRHCDNDCPPGWRCVLSGTNGTDSKSVCMVDTDVLCPECAPNPDCAGSEEVCNDGIDNDCNGQVDDGCTSARLEFLTLQVDFGTLPVESESQPVALILRNSGDRTAGVMQLD